jgi:hypothetical protein
VELDAQAADQVEDADCILLLTGSDMRKLERGQIVKVGDVVLQLDFSSHEEH